MPEALSITDTAYSGEHASYMISHAVIGADTLIKGCIYLQDGIKKEYTIPRVDVTNIMQKRNAIPTSSGNITVDSAVLVPKDHMLYQEFDPRDFEQHWFAEQMKDRLADAELPPTAEQFVMLQIMKRLNEFFENAIWRGRIEYDPDGLNVNPVSIGGTASDSQYIYWDGLIAKAMASSLTIKVPSPVALTGGSSGNITAQIQAAYLLVPPALLYKYGPMGLKLFVSYPDQQKLENTYALSPFKQQDLTQSGINKFNGYDVVPLAGLPANTFFWGMGVPDLASNLWIGINSMEDNKLEMMRLQANSEYWFFKGLFKTDVQIGFPEELVMYTLFTA